MPWKKNDSDQVVVENGNPIFVHPDGREEQFNGDSTLIRIGELKNEAKGYRQKHSELKKQVQPLLDADIDDVGDYLTRAKEALDLAETYKGKGAPGAEEIERIKQSVAATFEARIAEKDKLHKNEIETLGGLVKEKENSLKRQLVRGVFNASEFIRAKTYMLPEHAYDSFGNRFIVEEKDGDTKAYGLDANGEKIFSLKSGSGYAEPEEAIEIMIKSHPKRDQLLRSGPGGSGAQGGAHDISFTGKTIDASDTMAASQNLEKIASGEIVVTG